MRYTFVNCPVCGEMHTTSEVEFLNIEEDIHGRDVLTYICPTSLTGEEGQALVYANSQGG